MAQFIEVKDILLNPFNPRDFKEKSDLRHLMKLTESIQQFGINVPIKVYKVKGSKFWAILDGVTRYTAALSLGYEKIYCTMTGDGDCKLPKEMTHIDAIERIFEVQAKNKKHGTKLVLKSIKKIHGAGSSIAPNSQHANAYRVYEMSSPRVRELLVASNGGAYNSIGWSVLDVIYRHTTEEDEVMGWIMRYWDKEFTMHTLRKALADKYIVKKGCATHA